MGAVLARFNAELKRRALSFAVLSIAVGLAAGGIVALAAGARRTESAYDRFLDRSSPSDVLIQASSGFGPGVDLEAVARLPQVRRVARGVIVITARPSRSGRPIFGELAALASSDGRFGRSIDRWTLLEGRRPDDRRANEVVVGFEAARELGAHTGDIIELIFPKAAALFTAYAGFLAQLEDAAAERGVGGQFDFDGAVQGAVRLRAKVVGIAAIPGEVPPLAGTLSVASVHLTPAFYDKYAAGLTSTGFLAVQLRTGASLAAFKTAVEDLGGGVESTLFVTSEPTQTAAVNRSLRLQATALRIFGAFVLLVALLVVGQALARLTASESGDFPTLRALGMTRPELFAVGIARALTIAVPAAGVCALMAAGLSTFWPSGLAGRIEPAPGFAVDASAIGIGCALVLLLVMLVAAWPAWKATARASGRHPAPSRVHRRTRVLRSGSRSFAARIGIRLAIDPGRGQRAVPVRTAMAVGAVAIAATAMAVGFSSSLMRLRDTPRLYGWNWDAQIGTSGLPDVSGPLVAGLQANSAVRDIAVGTVTNVSVNDARVDALAFDPVRGRINPTLLEGRAPLTGDEIALGTATMRDLGVEIGDEVRVGVGTTSSTLRIVGRAVFPNLGDAAQLGRGAAMSFTALEAIDASATKQIVLVRVTPDASAVAARSRLRRALVGYPVFGPERPDDLVSLGNLDGLAVALGLMLAALAAATLAHTLVTSIRLRATDLAVLKALGVTRRQVSAVIGWQAATLLVIAIAIGVPVGIAAARGAWRVLAGELGVPAEPALNLFAVALIAPVVLLLGALAASGPAVAAARTPPARVLRGE